MPTLAWVLAAGVAMSLLALTGSLTLLLPDRAFKQLVLPLVALAAGSLVGGALCSTCSPRPSPPLGNRLIVYGWLAAGLFGFFLLEQYLHWHHCHRPLGAHRPLGYSDARGSAPGRTSHRPAIRKARPAQQPSGA